MQVSNLRDLKKLIQLCQSQGVKIIEIDGIKLELNSPVSKPKRYKQVKELDLNMPLEAQLRVPQMDQIETDELTPEQMMFYSADTQQ